MPRFAIERGHPDVEPDEPFALIAREAGGFRIVTANQTAEMAGVRPGHLLTDAQALVPALITEEHAPARDRAAIRHLALRATRWSPWVAGETEEEGAAGLLIDVEGCAHLFGGEEPLLADIKETLNAQGLTARLALAETIGAAHARARFAAIPSKILEGAAARDGLAALPVAALRLPHDMVRVLRRLGLKRIGDLLPLKRADLTARFGAALPRRLDQMLGREPESLSPLLPPASYRIRTMFAEPLISEAQVTRAIDKAAKDLARLLVDQAKGTRQLELVLTRVDGDAVRLVIGTASPSAHAPHLARLLKQRLDRLADRFDPGFGIDALQLSSLRHEEMAGEQHALVDGEAASAAEEITVLLDRLGARMGFETVTRPQGEESHIPERAVVWAPVAAAAHAPNEAAAWAQAAWASLPRERPFLMLPSAEPAEVTAEVPEGPPRQFRWRRVTYRVAKAEGPERVAPEWWKGDGARTRDYYRLEDEEGRRFWLYRDGLFERETDAPRWYVHGLFA